MIAASVSSGRETGESKDEGEGESEGEERQPVKMRQQRSGAIQRTDEGRNRGLGEGVRQGETRLRGVEMIERDIFWIPVSLEGVESGAGDAGGSAMGNTPPDER